MDHKTTEPDPQAPASPGEDVAMTDAQTLADMKDMKLVVMDSAELATRAASLAANAGLDLRNATKDLLHGNVQMLASNKKQSKFAIILLASAASLMLLTAALFENRIEDMIEFGWPSSMRWCWRWASGWWKWTLHWNWSVARKKCSSPSQPSRPK